MPQEGKISLLGLANWTDDLFSQMHWPDPFLPTTVNDEEVDPILSTDAFLDEVQGRINDFSCPGAYDFRKILD